MEISERRWKVHYKDTKDGDGSGILEMHPLWCPCLYTIMLYKYVSNIVGYKQKHVSYYNYWTSMLSWDVRELHSMSIYWNNIFSKRISIAIAKLVDGFIYFWFSGYLCRKWHKKNWTNIVTFTWPYFLFIFILLEYVIFVVKP